MTLVSVVLCKISHSGRTSLLIEISELCTKVQDHLRRFIDVIILKDFQSIFQKWFQTWLTVSRLLFFLILKDLIIYNEKSYKKNMYTSYSIYIQKLLYFIPYTYGYFLYKALIIKTYLSNVKAGGLSSHIIRGQQSGNGFPSTLTM